MAVSKLQKGILAPPARSAGERGEPNVLRQFTAYMNHAYILTLSCPDRPGIVHAVSGFLLERGGNIEEAAQYNDHDTGLFFMRVQFACDQLTLEDLKLQLKVLRRALQDGVEAARHPPAHARRDHGQQGRALPATTCCSAGKAACCRFDIAAIVSNHREFYQLAAGYNVPFHHIPVTAATKAQAEARQSEVIEAEGAELVVLARYMQVLSDDLCRKLSGRCDQHPPQLPARASRAQSRTTRPMTAA